MGSRGGLILSKFRPHSPGNWLSVSPLYLVRDPGPSRLSNISRHCHASPRVPLRHCRPPSQGSLRGNWIKRIHYYCRSSANSRPGLFEFRKSAERTIPFVLERIILLQLRGRGIRRVFGREKLSSPLFSRLPARWMAPNDRLGTPRTVRRKFAYSFGMSLKALYDIGMTNSD